MLLSLPFQTVGLLLCLPLHRLSVPLDVVDPILAFLSVTLSLLLQLLVFHLTVQGTLSVLVLVALTDFKDVLCLLFRFFNFFPGLLEVYDRKRETVQIAIDT